jgi:putative membrane protein
MSHHMLSHIVLMNLAAPLSAALFHQCNTGCAAKCNSISILIGASLLQLALLIGWHSPSSMRLVLDVPSVAHLMQISLFVSAFFFWFSIYQQVELNIWRGLIALLVTGKLYCMLAILLVLAPRALYTTGSPPVVIDLADQQLAGLMMVVACPLSYILIATILTSRWLNALRRTAALSSGTHWSPRWS